LRNTFAVFLHVWLATVQDVLQALWQLAWHSPQPVDSSFRMLAEATVWINFIAHSSENDFRSIYTILPPISQALHACFSSPSVKRSAENALSRIFIFV
jgi:hypothetical protein